MSEIKKRLMAGAVVALFMISMLVWVLVSPVGSSPDEDFHQTMIYCAANKTEHCLNEGNRYGHCFSMVPEIKGSCKDYAGLSLPVATKIDFRLTKSLYYQAMRFFVSDTLGVTTLKIRTSNVILAMLIALLSIVLTRKTNRKAVVYTFIVCSLPASYFFIASINPSAWAIIFVCAVLGPAYSLSQSFFNERDLKSDRTGMKNETNIARIIFIVLCIAVAAGSRYETMIWYPLVALFCIASAPGACLLFKANIKNCIFWVIFIGIVGYIIKTLLLNKVSPDLALGFVFENYMQWRTVEKSLNTLFGMMALTGIPGSELGTHDVPMSPITSFFISVAVGGSIILGLARGNAKNAFVTSLVTVTLFGITSILWSMVTWDVHQSRYFLPVLFLLVFSTLVGTTEKDFFNDRKVWLLILLSTIIVYSTALLSTELRFLYGLKFQTTRYPLGKEAHDMNPARLFESAIPDWWLIDTTWFSPFLLWVIGMACYGLAIIFTWLLLNQKTVGKG